MDVTSDVSDVTHRKRGLRFEKSQLSWIFASEEDGWLSRLAEALWQVSHVTGGGADGKVSIERLCSSLPHVEKTFNSKVIKSFVPELRSRQVFFVFRDSYVIYMCVMDIMNVLRTGMNMSISHNPIWLRNTWLNWIAWNRNVLTIKLSTYAKLNCLK